MKNLGTVLLHHEKKGKSKLKLRQHLVNCSSTPSVAVLQKQEYDPYCFQNGIQYEKSFIPGPGTFQLLVIPVSGAKAGAVSR